LAKTWISERLKNAIQHEYDQKLEVLKANIRAEQAIQDAANKNFLATHQVAFEKRIEAITAVWKATKELRVNIPLILQITDPLSVESRSAIIKSTQDHEIREQVSFQSLAETFNNISKDADSFRPFAGKYLMALFDAYQSIIITTAILMDLDYRTGSSRSLSADNEMDYLLKSFMTDEEYLKYAHNSSSSNGLAI